MATLMNMNQLVDEAGMIGGSIPTSVANGILANCGSISEATDAMNSLITLAQAVQAAGMEGQEIPPTIAEKVASGQETVGEAVAEMMSLTDKNMEDAGDKMLKDSQDSIKGIADAFANDGTTSAAVGKMSGKMEKAMQSSLDNMVTSSAKAYADIKSNIDKAQKYADDHPITTTQQTIKRQKLLMVITIKNITNNLCLMLVDL